MIGFRALLDSVHNSLKLVPYHLLSIRARKFLVSFCPKTLIKKEKLSGEAMILINMRNKDLLTKILNGLI